MVHKFVFCTIVPNTKHASPVNEPIKRQREVGRYRLRILSIASLLRDLRMGGTHPAHEGCEGKRLTRVEELAPGVNAVTPHAKAEGALWWHWLIRHGRQFAAQRVVACLKLVQALRGLLKSGAIFRAHRAVELAIAALPHHRDHLIAHTTIDRLVLDVLFAKGRAAARANRRAATGRANARVKVKVADAFHRADHRVANGAPRPIGLDLIGRHAARLLRQPGLANQRHRHGTIGAGAGNRARPQIGHRSGTLVLRVEIADLRTRPVEHPRTPALHISHQGCARLLAGRTGPVGVLLRVDQGRKLDDMRDRVQVKGIRLAAQAQRFERDGPAAGERVEYTGSAVGKRLLDVGASVLDEVMGLFAAQRTGAINAIVPIRQAGDEVLQLLRRCGVFRLRHQGGKDGRTTRRQRSPRPPDMQGREMPVADRLLAGAMLGDLRQGHLDFDDAAVVGVRGH